MSKINPSVPDVQSPHASPPGAPLRESARGCSPAHAGAPAGERGYHHESTHPTLGRVSCHWTPPRVPMADASSLRAHLHSIQVELQAVEQCTGYNCDKWLRDDVLNSIADMENTIRDLHLLLVQVRTAAKGVA